MWKIARIGLAVLSGLRSVPGVRFGAYRKLSSVMLCLSFVFSVAFLAALLFASGVVKVSQVTVVVVVVVIVVIALMSTSSSWAELPQTSRSCDLC